MPAVNCTFYLHQTVLYVLHISEAPLHFPGVIIKTWNKRGRTCHHFNVTGNTRRERTDLQDAAPLRLTGDVFAGLEHPQRHAVEQDDQHGHVLEPRAHRG